MPTQKTDGLMRFVRITQADLFTEATARFGVDPLDIAFVCPRCGDVATLREWKTTDTTDRAGQECIGRVLGALVKPVPTNTRGCDWAAHGLLRGPWEIVVPGEGDTPDRSLWGFPLAGEPAPGGPVAAFLAGRAVRS